MRDPGPNWAKESLQYLGFILFSMNHTFTSMIHAKKV
jgi:hypothetical protein